MATPLLRLTGMFAMSSAVCPRAVTRTSASVAPRSAEPAGASTFSCCSAITTSDRETWYASSRARSTITWISRVASPTRFTAPTPGTFSRRRFTTLSARSVAAAGESPGAFTDTDTMGRAPGSMRWTMGSSISRGRSPRIPATLPRMSCEATWVETSRLKNTTMFDSPSCDVDSTCLMPWTVLIDSSMRFVTSRSTVSGEAPW